MGEWWTYRLEDFLMFSPRTWWRTVALYNQAFWPGQLLAWAAGLAAWLAALRGSAASQRCALGLLAAAWAWVAWGFQARHHAAIHIAGPWLVAAWAAQALLLLAATAWAPRGTPAWRRTASGALALALAWPLLARLLGRPWSEAEVFGFMPLPTALATLALLALLQLGRLRPLLAALPVLALAWEVLTRWAMLSS